MLAALEQSGLALELEDASLKKSEIGIVLEFVDASLKKSEKVVLATVDP